MLAYYNEIDPYAVCWLRNLIDNRLIMPGQVDDRSIKDVKLRDIDGFNRCHFFAGIAGWELALKLSDWPENIPVWTGSCPCQPYSVASHGLSKNDKVLWPCWFRLVQQSKPPVIFSEQVDSLAGRKWLEKAIYDLSRIGYNVTYASICASLLGFPRRRRLWLAADSDSNIERNGTIHAKMASLQASSEMVRVNWRELRRMDKDSNGVPATMGRRRAYGNAIVPQVASAFISAWLL